MMQLERLKFNCKFPSCTSQYKSGANNKHFFKFPSYPALCMKWKAFCNISANTDTRHFRLCEDHFKESDFWNKDKKRIKYETIPSLHKVSFAQPATSSVSINTKQLIKSSVHIEDHNYCKISYELLPEGYPYMPVNQYNTNESISFLAIDNEFSKFYFLEDHTYCVQQLLNEDNIVQTNSM
ncbi:hypothetical protein WA026_017506 [Henosepilachna vigintioctopunctata]|uniref:THAP-type domain-containing protein n=1 Tax=Henosepilachna vigintioctopunctata TaxID=420089 RepID=A0AAW1V2R1_9CUCU